LSKREGKREASKFEETFTVGCEYGFEAGVDKVCSGGQRDVARWGRAGRKKIVNVEPELNKNRGGGRRKRGIRKRERRVTSIGPRNGQWSLVLTCTTLNVLSPFLNPGETQKVRRKKRADMCPQAACGRKIMWDRPKTCCDKQEQLT